jgi:hypothetical protein
MAESPLERGVIWVGANDGPVHVTRDNGKTWKNVTPPDLPPGGRVQNIDASSIRRGAAYIAVYRFLREHDLKPYVYATSDYGATWQRLADGTNGIPGDHPVRVVREDPEREGLLYAGTEFGFFVSFDHGAAWQPLQQNLPATPVTDIRVKRGDLVIATMGRSFWIMDDIGPLRQIAGGIPTSATAGSGRRSGDRAAPGVASNGGATTGGAAMGPGQARAAALDLSQPVLLQPATQVRYRRAGGGRGGGPVPQYPPVALPIDYILPDGFTGTVSLEISDAAGRVVRAIESAGAGRGRGRGRGADPDAEMRGGGGRGRGGAVPATAKPGHNRYWWDYRWANNGPMAAPGKYTVKLVTGAGATGAGPAAAPDPAVRTFEIRVDPAVLRDGITTADLVEQQDFLLRVRDAIGEATGLRARIQQAMQKAGVPAPESPGPGEWVGAMTYAHPLQRLWARVVTAPGTYEQGMLIDQLSNLVSAEGGADQKIGAEARTRFDDLVREMTAIEAELQKIGSRMP